MKIFIHVVKVAKQGTDQQTCSLGDRCLLVWTPLEAVFSVLVLVLHRAYWSWFWSRCRKIGLEYFFRNQSCITAFTTSYVIACPIGVGVQSTFGGKSV